VHATFQRVRKLLSTQVRVVRKMSVSEALLYAWLLALQVRPPHRTLLVTAHEPQRASAPFCSSTRA